MKNEAVAAATERLEGNQFPIHLWISVKQHMAPALSSKSSPGYSALNVPVQSGHLCHSAHRHSVVRSGQKLQKYADVDEKMVKTLNILYMVLPSVTLF